MRDTRWETRLLALVAAILVVFGLTAVYGASSLLTISGGQVGSSFALKQALGVESQLIPGSGGIFEVAVQGKVVAKKSMEGFPTEEDVVKAVGSALKR